MKYCGLYTALITPFRDGRVDAEAYRALIERQIAAGVDGIVPVGTTGESPTLSHKEHADVIRLAIETARDRVQVIAGTGSNSTEEAVALTRDAEKMGAHGTLQVCPYYNKPSREGLYRHFRMVAEATSLPVMLYSIPGRCGIEIPVEVIVRLASDCPNVIAVKEAGGSVDRVNRLCEALPDDFSVLCGDDGLAVPFISCGAQGLVSVTSNLAPDFMKRLVDAALSGDMNAARALQKKFYPLMKGLMTLDTNPVPIKAALALRGEISWDIRLPLAPLHEEKQDVLRGLLNRFHLL